MMILFICVGNCAIINPSESTAHTAELLHRLIPFYLDNVSYYIAGVIGMFSFIKLQHTFNIVVSTFYFEYTSWKFLPRFFSSSSGLMTNLNRFSLFVFKEVILKCIH